MAILGRLRVWGGGTGLQKICNPPPPKDHNSIFFNLQQIIQSFRVKTSKIHLRIIKSNPAIILFILKMNIYRL